jgi:hypothetical protein
MAFSSLVELHLEGNPSDGVAFIIELRLITAKHAIRVDPLGRS